MPAPRFTAALSATPRNTQKIWLFVIAVLKTPLPKACQFTREATSNHMNKRPHVSLTSRKSTVEMSCHTSSLVGSFSSILTLPGDEDVFTGLGEIFRFGFWVPGLLVVRVYSLGSGSGPDEIHIQLVFDCLLEFKTSCGQYQCSKLHFTRNSAITVR